MTFGRPTDPLPEEDASVPPPGSPMHPRLGSGAEFDAIRELLSGLPEEPSTGVAVGPGDDAAVLSLAGSEDLALLLSVDRMTEGVHFRTEWLDLEAVGWRAVAASLSDVAAMAGEPAGLLVSLGLPDVDGRSRDLRDIREGLAEACRTFGAPVLGGDLTRSPHGVVVDVTAVGRAERPVTRSGGRPGQLLWVTGRLGGSGAAVAAWQAGRRPPDQALRRFARPWPRLEEAAWLAGHGVMEALIDLSDGLAGDAGHLAAAGGIAVVVDEATLPVDPAAEEVMGDVEAARRLALGGGEDFELAFLAPPGRVEELVEPFRHRFGLELTCVGNATEGEGAWLRPASGGDPESLVATGYDHFRPGDDR